jgi:hypothetical protein
VSPPLTTTRRLIRPADAPPLGSPDYFEYCGTSGVDDVLDLNPVPIPVPGPGHFSQALPGHFCVTAKVRPREKALESKDKRHRTGAGWSQ